MGLREPTDGRDNWRRSKGGRQSGEEKPSLRQALQGRVAGTSHYRNVPVWVSNQNCDADQTDCSQQNHSDDANQREHEGQHNCTNCCPPIARICRRRCHVRSCVYLDDRTHNEEFPTHSETCKLDFDGSGYETDKLYVQTARHPNEYTHVWAVFALPATYLACSGFLLAIAFLAVVWTSGGAHARLPQHTSDHLWSHRLLMIGIAYPFCRSFQVWETFDNLCEPVKALDDDKV